MKVYALFCNGQFVVAKPMSSPPSSAMDFGVAELPTSVYDIAEAMVAAPAGSGWGITIPATIDVGARGLDFGG